MGKQREVKSHTVKGRPLSCPVCEHTQFWTRKTLMNTRGASFLGWDFVNKEAENYVCGNCNYVMWFLA